MNEIAAPGPVAAESTRDRGVGRWLRATDHKQIGLLYIGTGLGFFVIAIAFALLMRAQLARPGMKLLSPEQYNQVFSMHGTTMVFLFAMPMLIGFANYLVPLQIGARDMAFPRLNALSYWLFAAGGLFLYSSFFFGGALDTGWFSYAPLTLAKYSPHDGVTFWTVSLAILGASSILGSINFIATMLKMRAPGMTLMRMPMFSVATFVNSFLILFAFPSLTAAIAMLYLDRRYGTAFFNPDKGGDPLVWQHLFWFFGHPEVYILILPAFGMVSEVVPVFSRKPLFGRTSMIVMIGVIGFFGFAVWAHHMFATGLPTVFNSIMAATSMLIAIPTGVKIFNWLATMWGGSLRLKTSLLFCCGMIALFTVGGISGVSLAVVPFDWQVTDTYYVVAHLHNVLIAGTLFGVFAGFYYWFPKMAGRRLDDRLGKWHFWLILVGFMVTFMPMYALGFLGMPRRVSTYASDVGWNTANLISSIGGYIIAASLVVFLVNVLRSRRRGEVAGDNPWEAWTLEWATSSPPPHGNFVSLPPVNSPRPLWDLEQASSGADAGAAMPDAPAEPPAAPAAAPPDPPAAGAAALEAGDHMTAVPLFAALAVLVMATGLIWSLVLTALGCAMLLVVMAVWMSPGHPWPAVPPLPGERFSAAGVATLAFIGSESIFFIALIAAAVHLRLHVDPLNAGRDLGIVLPTINTTILVLSGITAHYGLTRYRQGRVRASLMHFGFTVALGIAFLCGQAWEYTHMGFGLADGVVGSTFYTLTGFHGMHVAAGILGLVFLFVRVRRDATRGTAAASQQALGFAEAGTFYWHFVDAVWVAVFVVVYLL